MHLFIAFVVIVLLIGLGFWRAMLYVSGGIVGVIALFYWLALQPARPAPPATQVSQAQPDCSNLFAGLVGSDGMIIVPCKQPPQAERTDVYQQSLQIMSGEHLTPLN